MFRRYVVIHFITRESQVDVILRIVEPEHVVKQHMDTLATQLDEKLDAAEQILSILRDGLHAETEDRKASQASHDEKTQDLESQMAALRIELVEQRTGVQEKVSTPAAESKLAQVDWKITNLAKEFHSLQRIVQARTKQHAKIDDCPTRDSLYEFYHLLDRDIAAAEGGRNGPFEGDFDELWHLRDRTVGRLAMFDLYGEAMKEAKNAVVDV